MVGLGVVATSAALTGALVVGDSMRGSLRQAALDRLGDIRFALNSRYFVRASLADRIGTDLPPDLVPGDAMPADVAPVEVVPLILLRGGALQPATRVRVGGVNLLGVDVPLHRLFPSSTEGDQPGADHKQRPPGTIGFSDDRSRGDPAPDPTDRSVWLGRRLAVDLGAAVGDEVVFYLGKGSPVATETLLGRRDDAGASLRLRVAGVLADDAGGRFSLRSGEVDPRNAWVPLSLLQRTLGRRDRVNALLVILRATPGRAQPEMTEVLTRALASSIGLEDFGLTLRVDDSRGYVALESDGLLIEPIIEQVALDTARSLGVSATPIYSYLANSIEVIEESSTTDGALSDDRGIPYSVVAAVDPEYGTARFRLPDGSPPSLLEADAVYLNDWTASNLKADAGDTVRLTYFVSADRGRLVTEHHDFHLAGVLPMDATAADPGFTPRYEGITDADSLADWDPPFPIDLKRITDRDESYWKEFRTSPKVFIRLEDGRRLWATKADRFGRTTSIRFTPPTGVDGSTFSSHVADAMVSSLNPSALGLRFEDLRTSSLEASRSSTDFGLLFIGFSMFLIASAAMFSSLMFRLGIERRAPEIGLLRAVGFVPGKVLAIFLGEGVFMALAGALTGTAAALGYAALMLIELRSHPALNGLPSLGLHARIGTLALGTVLSLATALTSIVWVVRNLGSWAPRTLLAGAVTAGPSGPDGPEGRTSLSTWLGRGGLLLAGTGLIGVAATRSVPPAMAFFLVGVVALVFALTILNGILRRGALGPEIIHGGHGAWIALGVRSLSRNAGRSLLTIGLLGSSTFVVIAVGAFHLDTEGEGPQSGTGGYALIGESGIAVPYDLDTVDGRSALAMESSEPILDRMQVQSFRLRSGDDTACTNVYQPGEPRILGAADSFLAAGRFQFSGSLAQTDEEHRNPWRLLHRRFPDGAVPAIGDEAAVRWQLKLGLGHDLPIQDGLGRTTRLRFVAMLSGSALQSEIVVAEAAFEELFPAISDRAFFLIEAPSDQVNEVGATLERELSRFAFDVTPTIDRLRSYQSVQNQYLATFQLLGGLGIVLGSGGLAVVMLRNVWERRRELALLRAVGFSRSAIRWMVLAESVALVLGGVVMGAIPAGLAILPQLIERSHAVPFIRLGVTLGGIVLFGVSAGAVALGPALRVPVSLNLRRD